MAAVVLAAVFAWAAAAKGARHGATAAAFTALGVPAPQILAVAVPIVEAVIAALLVIRPAVGGALALAALAAFTMVVVRAVSRGTSSGCGCFGARRTEPVGPADVIRNGVFAALAAVATGTERLVRPGWGAVAAVAVALMAAAVGLRKAHEVFGRPGAAGMGAGRDGSAASPPGRRPYR